MKTIKIKNRIIGEGYPTYIIAEMSANHAGSIKNAKEIIRKAKECGADCVKIQTYTPDTLTIDCDNEYFRIDQGTWKGENLYSLYGKAFTPWEWQAELMAEAESCGLDFFSTPFDKTSVDFLESINIQFYKIASFELVDLPLIEYVASKGKPIIMSTGMGSFNEIKEAVDVVRSQGNEKLALLKCSSSYPTVTSDMNLKTIKHMQDSFNVPVGLSDHSMGSIGAIVAVAMGASIIEKHFCLSRKIENPDASFSMEPAEFKTMVDDIRMAEKSIGIVSYDVTEKEQTSRVFRKSVFAVKDIKKGDIFTMDNIRIIRPGYGLKPKYYNKVLNNHASQDIDKGTPIKIELITEALMGEVYFVKARWDDVDLLFEWANDDDVRKNSFSSEKINYEDHKKWFKKSLADKDVDNYICYLDSNSVGQIRLDYQNGEAVINYSIDRNYRGRGLGEMIIKLIESSIIDNRPDIKLLIGRVKFQNIASQRIFEKNNYVRKPVEESSEGFVYVKTINSIESVNIPD